MQKISKSPGHQARVAATAAVCTTLMLAGLCGSAKANAGLNLSLSRLASLTNYSFTNTVSNYGYKLEVDGRVHGPRDWQTNAVLPVKESTYDVNGHGYSVALGHVLAVTFRTPEGLTHLNGEYTAARSLIGFTHMAGLRVSRRGTCRVAGVAGWRYFLQSPRVAQRILLETVSACIAKRSGALLAYDFGVPSGSELHNLHVRDLSMSFAVTSVGHVGAIRAPKR